MFGGDDRDLILADLDLGLPDAEFQPTFENLERHASSLIGLIECLRQCGTPGAPSEMPRP